MKETSMLQTTTDQPPTTMRRSGTTGVHSVDRVVFTAPDLDEAERFYRAFALDVQRTEDHLDLCTCAAGMSS